jgi:hypothetical protein
MSMQPSQPDVEWLVRAHREAQADQRAAIAAEHDRDLTRARLRIAAIDARLCEHGHHNLADQLDRETAAGAALVAALTCPDQRGSGGEDPDELWCEAGAGHHESALLAAVDLLGHL